MLLKDTRRGVKRLQEGDVPEKQAHAIVDLFVDADEQIATKQGLATSSRSSTVWKHVRTRKLTG